MGTDSARSSWWVPRAQDGRTADDFVHEAGARADELAELEEIWEERGSDEIARARDSNPYLGVTDSELAELIRTTDSSATQQALLEVVQRRVVKRSAAERRDAARNRRRKRSGAPVD